MSSYFHKYIKSAACRIKIVSCCQSQVLNLAGEGYSEVETERRGPDLDLVVNEHLLNIGKDL